MSEGLHHWGFIDLTGRFAIPPRFAVPFDIPPRFSDGLALVLSSKRTSRGHNLYQYVTKTGEIAFPGDFEQAQNFSEGLAAVFVGGYENGQWGYLDKSGRMAINPRFDRAANFADGFAAVKSGDHEKVPFSTSQRANESRWGYINTKGELLNAQQYEEAGEFSEGLAVVKQSGRYGIIDKGGSFVARPQFDIAFCESPRSPSSTEYPWISCFSEGLCEVGVGNLYGYVDRSGAFVITPQFLGADRFIGGLAAVSGPDKTVGYIDRTGRFAIPPRFSFASPFEPNGLARVWVRDKPGNSDSRDGWFHKVGIIDRTGRYVWEPTR